MSEEIATTDANITAMQQLREEIATASNVIEGLKRAMAQVKAERQQMETERDYWRGQAQDALAELHAVEEQRNATEAELREQLRIADLEIAADALARAEADAAALYREFHAALTTIGGRLYAQGKGDKWQMDLLAFVRDERARLERQYDNAV